jgi:hypothetical protein
MPKIIQFPERKSREPDAVERDPADRDAVVIEYGLVRKETVAVMATVIAGSRRSIPVEIEEWPLDFLTIG